MGQTESIDEKRRIEALRKEFAIKCGWPKVRDYKCDHWDLLAQIPGSFAALERPEGCYISISLAAYFEVAAKVVHKYGYERKHLSFGLSPKIYALGETSEEAMKKVMETREYEMPSYGGQISYQRRYDIVATDFFRWRREYNKSRDLPSWTAVFIE